MNSVEMVDIFDQSGRVMKTISREEAEDQNHITENVVVFLFNLSGEVWTQLRPMTKKHYPGLWDVSVCGGITIDVETNKSETPLVAAERETYEETSGIQIPLTLVKSFLNVFPGDDGEVRSRFTHEFIGVTDEIPQPNEEVDEFRKYPPESLRTRVINYPREFIPSFIVELDIALEGYKKLISE